MREDFNPRYVEVRRIFSNACNFKCSYCGPPYSSTWMNEIKQHGAYPTTDKFNGMEGMVEKTKFQYYTKITIHMLKHFGNGGQTYIVIYIHLELQVVNQCYQKILGKF